MRPMRTLAGLLNIVLGLLLAFAVATVVNLDFPADVAAYIVGGLLVVAGIGILTRASWGAQLGQWLAVGGILLGVALLAGAAVTLATVPDWGGLVSAVMAVLGIPVIVASVLAFLANRRARTSAGS
jgi:peptidoglycan/LPS O-acetylase OafA/YrhL